MLLFFVHNTSHVKCCYATYRACASETDVIILARLGVCRELPFHLRTRDLSAIEQVLGCPTVRAPSRTAQST